MANIHNKYFKNSALNQNVECKPAEISEKLEWEAKNQLEERTLEAMDHFVQSKESFLIFATKILISTSMLTGGLCVTSFLWQRIFSLLS